MVGYALLTLLFCVVCCKTISSDVSILVNFRTRQPRDGIKRH